MEQMRNSTKSVGKDKKKFTKLSKAKPKQPATQLSLDVHDRLTLAKVPLKTLKYFGLFLGNLLKMTAKKAIFGWKFLLLILGSIWIATKIDWRIATTIDWKIAKITATFSHVALKWFQNGVKSSFQLNQVSNQYATNFGKFLIENNSKNSVFSGVQL